MHADGARRLPDDEADLRRVSVEFCGDREAKRYEYFLIRSLHARLRVFEG